MNEIQTLPTAERKAPKWRRASGIAALISGFTAALTAAQAHPGHSWREAGPLHLISSPDHLAVLAVAGAALLFAGFCIRRRGPRRAMQILGVAALIAAALLWPAHG